MPLYNVNKEKMEKIGDLFSMRGKAQESLKTLYAGDVGVISKLQDTSTGDTLAAKEAPITYLPLNYVKPMLLEIFGSQEKRR
jgi:elongation factor G